MRQKQLQSAMHFFFVVKNVTTTESSQRLARLQNTWLSAAESKWGVCAFVLLSDQRSSYVDMWHLPLFEFTCEPASSYC